MQKKKNTNIYQHGQYNHSPQDRVFLPICMNKILGVDPSATIENGKQIFRGKYTLPPEQQLHIPL